MQFQYNSDLPSLEAQDPAEFPPASPNPCARITTRIFHPSRNEVSTVQNVLIKTPMPPIRRSLLQQQQQNGDASMVLDDDMSSSSSSDDDDSMESVEPEPATVNQADSANENNGVVERAYWMQRTIREAIYGRVLFAVVLEKRVAPSRDNDNTPAAEWQVTKEKCAIKEMSWQHIRRERDKLAEDPIKEVSAMQYMKEWWDAKHACSAISTLPKAALFDANIMMPLDLLSDDRYLYSIMPYCDGGELFDRLDTNEKFSEEESRYWMHQVLNGLENLQHAGVCHRDMSLENLLVHQNGALIIDMGMCLRVPYAAEAPSLASSMMNMTLEKPLAAGMGDIPNGDNIKASASVLNRPRHWIKPQGTCGKWVYMSPEVYQNKEPFDGFAVDMWAAGVILFLMLTGFPPWEQAVPTDERFKYMTAGYLVQMLTEWELGLSSDAMDLLQRMLWLDPKDRLSLEQVRGHPWMVNGKASISSQGTSL